MEGIVARLRPLGQPHPLALAGDRDDRLLAGAGEEEFEADAEDQRDAQQRRQRRKQAAALDLREHRRRQSRVLPELDETHLFFRRSVRSFPPMS